MHCHHYRTDADNNADRAIVDHLVNGPGTHNHNHDHHDHVAESGFHLLNS
jgi:hypothetical protein